MEQEESTDHFGHLTRQQQRSRCLQMFSAYRLVGLVVKASASRVEDPGFESRLRQDFFGVESYQ